MKKPAAQHTVPFLSLLIHKFYMIQADVLIDKATTE